jgi:hypothetical protein
MCFKAVIYDLDRDLELPLIPEDKTNQHTQDGNTSIE